MPNCLVDNMRNRNTVLQLRLEWESQNSLQVSDFSSHSLTAIPMIRITSQWNQMSGITRWITFECIESSNLEPSSAGITFD